MRWIYTIGFGFHWKDNSKIFMIFPQVKCCLSIWLVDVGTCFCLKLNRPQGWTHGDKLFLGINSTYILLIIIKL